MEVKLFEIRDRATFIPVMATALIERGESERYLLRRAGYSREQIQHIKLPAVPRYVILCKLDGVEACYDPFHWPGLARTMMEAHRYIIDNWDALQSGTVIDVEFILGESELPKESERLEHA